MSSVKVDDFLEPLKVPLAAPHLPTPALRIDVAACPTGGLLTVSGVADATPYHPPAPAFAHVEAGSQGGLCGDHETKLTEGDQNRSGDWFRRLLGHGNAGGPSRVDRIG